MPALSLKFPAIGGFTASIAMGVILSATPLRAAEKPFNRVIVVIDASGSYLSRQGDAITMVDQLLVGLSKHKTKKWEQADKIEIISLDAIPEIIWSGTPAQLHQTDKAEWVKRFKARTDYKNCTDVTAAFDLAARQLATDPKPAEKYLFVFSDLINEPPAGSVAKCLLPETPSVPGDDFAWHRLADVKIAAFWLPPAQKMAWNTAMKEHGLTAYRLLTTSESGISDIDIPEPAKRMVTMAERQEARNKVQGWGKSALIFFGWFFAVIVLVGGTIVGIAKMRRKGRAHSAPPAPGGRLINGPVAPMHVPRSPQ